MTLSLLPVHSDGCLNLGSLDQAAFVTVILTNNGLFIAKLAILPVWVLCELNGVTERGNENAQTFRWMPRLHASTEYTWKMQEKSFSQTCCLLL